MKIALLGFGIEAQSAYNFLKKKYPSATFDIYDQNQISKVKTPEGSEIFLGVSDFSSIDADLLVRTPAINPKDLPISANVTSVTNLFFEQCRAPIIGVTGSKGKGTTASFITEILRSAGLKVQLLGNIGIPALDKIDDINQDSIVVYELSSFQLWDLKYAPRVAVITNIEPDHLDVHDDFDDYVSAKMNITRLQDSSDFLVYNYLNKIVHDNVSKIKTEASTNFIPFPSDKFAKVLGDYFYWKDEKLFSTDAVKLPGKHNLMNALAAMDATFNILVEKGLEFENIKQAWKSGLSAFEGLPHRLKFVTEKSGVRYYDDSIATTPGSAIAAIDSFKGPKILIMGGSNKGADLNELIEKVALSGEKEIKKVILIGDESNNLEKLLLDKKFNRFINLGLDTDMQKIVKSASSISNSGDIVILSPAHASFDMFKSYSDRGEQFIKAVKEL